MVVNSFLILFGICIQTIADLNLNLFETDLYFNNEP